MIYLAIDEEQRAGSREQITADANSGVWSQPLSALCSHISALSERRNAREDEEARLERIHLQAGQE